MENLPDIDPKNKVRQQKEPVEGDTPIAKSPIMSANSPDLETRFTLEGATKAAESRRNKGGE